MRYKPLVIIVTDGMNMTERGITPDLRRRETLRAMEVLNASALFLGIKDDRGGANDVMNALAALKPEIVFAPAVYPKGHIWHNIVGQVAMALFPEKLCKYATYQTDDYSLKGDIMIMPTPKEKELKDKALAMYESQHSIAAIHFQEVKNKPEWYVL
jgi:LmbE family N-acetylglucosaminyl deacetylase